MPEETTLVLDEKGMFRVMTRIAHEVVERNRGATDIALVGIRRRGDSLAKRLATLISEIEGHPIPVGALDITLYRDDFQTRFPQPVVRKTAIPFDIERRTIILVDDVLYTGRTIRAALDELTDFGRAKRIQLAVLIDRDGRELPIQADYVGEHIPTTPHETVVVRVREVDGEDSVTIERTDRGQGSGVRGQ
ncbi:MAG: bifunctional pyr operon transcriptional regulator/uracil phosphoribosyltransferase PyrR [Candidatus Latescibacteria bacterium]|nr:bifunctional pyr operon transcriptional regulator/uracil phosphoribosyltransferase PyrR [Candidatus Latescibacterota bacterium]